MAQVLEPVIAAYAPDLIIVSAGYDAVMGDPLGGMALSPELYGHLTERMARLARGKLALALEGLVHPCLRISCLLTACLAAVTACSVSSR
jgi:acetoin utilization deacetylase AcuC-like enzyme